MEGYHTMSVLAGNQPNLAIFRLFKNPNTLNLLVLQAEITNLWQALGDAAQKELLAATRAGRKSANESVFGLKEYFKTPASAPAAAAEYAIILKLRELLSVYNQALLSHRAVSLLPSVKEDDLSALRAWLKDEGGRSKWLRDAEAKQWDDASDLTSLLASGDNEDTISRWIEGPVLRAYYQHIGFRYKDHKLPLHDSVFGDPVTVPFDHYDDKNVTHFVTGLCTVFAAVLPCLSIFLLYYIHRPLVRLSVILILSMIFSFALTLLTRAKRDSIFASTAAFSAVLVVFVGSTTT